MGKKDPDMQQQPTQERVFLRVLFDSDEEPRLFQLQPHVKFGNVLRTLKKDGTLYWGSRPIGPSDTSEALGLKCGIQHSVDLRFSSAASPSASPKRGQSPPQRFNEANELLRRIESEANQRTTSSIVMSNAPLSRAAAALYNPYASAMRSDQVRQMDAAPVAVGLPSTNLPSTSGRAARHALPSEKSHGDTMIPHTPWPCEVTTTTKSMELLAPSTIQGVVAQPPQRHLVLNTAPSKALITAAAPSSPPERKEPLDAAAVEILTDQLLLLKRELEAERRTREAMQKKIEFLVDSIPKETLAWAAEQEHLRLMKDLRTQRHLSRSMESTPSEQKISI